MKVVIMRNVVLAAAIGVLVAAGSLVAPAAHADIPLECHPGCWGAIAWSPSTGEEALRQNYPTEQNAKDQAVLWCDVTGKTNDCQVVVSGLGCLSIAESSDGINRDRATSVHEDGADAAALAGAGPGSMIDLNGCSG